MTDESLNDAGRKQTIKRNPFLERLDVLVGEWEMRTPQYPDVKGRVVFAWLEEGAFLTQRASAENSSFPSSISIYGLDDTKEAFTMLYYDNRGVSRVYQMSLSDRSWKIWRDAPGFSQRFTGTFNEAGSTITAFWEKSFDGVHWEHDFDLIYTKTE